MIRITRMTDYAIVILTQFVLHPDPKVHNAKDIAAFAHVPQPTVAKILKSLSKSGLLDSHRGVKGGYRLARAAEEISVAEIVDSMEGEIAITECSVHADNSCELESWCPITSNWKHINELVRTALQDVTLADLAQTQRRSPLVQLGVNTDVDC